MTTTSPMPDLAELFVLLKTADIYSHQHVTSSLTLVGSTASHDVTMSSVNASLETTSSGGNATVVVGEASPLKVVLVSIIVSMLVIVTAGGNLMVMISMRMDKQLQTISNYFLLSLSVADFTIGQ